MTSKRNNNKTKPFPRFEQAQPFDPAEFNTALNWYENAATQKAQVSNPTDYRLNIELELGKVEHIVLTENPTNRGMIALKERYGDDTEKFFSMAARMMALFHIMHNPSIKKYMVDNGEYTEIHPAIIDAAALVLLDKHGNFPIDVFLSKVVELIETKYDGDDTLS